jgi:glycosyltransferase involved in cell wall biosynthesis
MNILFLLRRVSASSGVDISTKILANEFINMGNNVNLCCLDFSDDSVSSKIKYFKIFGDWKKIDTLQNINILKNTIQKENINIIINQECQNIPWVNLVKIATEKADIKIISCLHFPVLMSINHFATRTKFFPRFFVKFIKKCKDLRAVNFAYDNSDFLVLLSEKFLEHYKKLQLKKDLSKLRVIANPLSMDIEKIDFGKKRKTILFVGRISEFQKRLSLIIEVWKIILNTNKYNDWNLKIVGDGEDLDTIKEMAKKLDRIYFEGRQESESYFEEASIFIMTSAFEGFPMTLVESLERGCVPIAMDSFLSLSDVIENGKNGFIIPNGDINAMAEKIQILMTDESLRKEMALNGLQSVKKFDVKIIAKEWEKLFSYAQGKNNAHI